jgi:hypothetical protein
MVTVDKEEERKKKKGSNTYSWLPGNNFGCKTMENDL